MPHIIPFRGTKEQKAIEVMQEVLLVAKQQVDTMRVLFWGMLGQLSRLPLEALLAAGHAIVGVVVPDDGEGIGLRPLAQPRRAIPLVVPPTQRTVVEVAWERSIPVYAAATLREPETHALAALQPDVAAVSCFNRRIPLALAALPPLGTLNLHPSLLPAYRGPAPLFWALRDGRDASGVTVHLLDDGLDTGPIVAQAQVTLPNGASGAKIERVYGERGGALLVEALTMLANNTATMRPQPAEGDYRPWPAPDDFRIEPSWSARRAFNFMRGTAEWSQPYSIAVGGEVFLLARALGYELEATLDGPFVREGRVLRVQCAPGVLVGQVVY